MSKRKAHTEDFKSKAMRLYTKRSNLSQTDIPTLDFATGQPPLVFSQSNVISAMIQNFPISVYITYEDVFQRKATINELTAFLSRYHVLDVLCFLSHLGDAF